MVGPQEVGVARSSFVIGASLSEPHINGTNVREIYVYIYVYIYMCRTSVTDRMF